MAKKTASPSLAAEFRKAAASNSGRVHVVPSKSGWSVKREGNLKASAVRKTKASAITAAKSIQSADRIIVHKKDGTIQKNTAKR
jgi:hypothetical protein